MGQDSLYVQMPRGPRMVDTRFIFNGGFERKRFLNRLDMSYMRVKRVLYRRDLH